MSTLCFCIGLYYICLMKKKKMKMKKRGKEKKKQPDLRIHHPVQSSRTTLHNLCKPRLLTSYLQFFLFLGINGITSRKALLFLFV